LKKSGAEKILDVLAALGCYCEDENCSLSAAPILERDELL
jgi:hypothetical protein